MRKVIVLSLVVLIFLGVQFSNSKQSIKSFPSYSPIPIEKIKPEIPGILSRLDVDGKVGLSVLISESGRVIDVKIVDSLFIQIDSACIKAVKSWKFKPCRISDKHGKYQSVKCWTPIYFFWNSHDGEIVRY